MKGLEDLQRFARVRDWRRGKFPRKMIKTGELQQTAGLIHVAGEYAIYHDKSGHTRNDYSWVVTHLGSGCWIAMFDDKESGMGFVQQVMDAYPDLGRCGPVITGCLSQADVYAIKAIASSWVCFHAGTETLKDFRAWAKSKR